jgi:hypothetical protein
MKRFRVLSPHSSPGFALLAAFLLLLLLSAMAAGVVYMVMVETRLGGTDRENALAYYGAEAAMEKMMADLSALYAGMQAPTQADADALETSQPGIPDVQYPEYDIADIGASQTRNISAGPHQGLIALITPVSLRVTARRPSGAEVRMIRTVEVARIPVFQFGIFSDTDLSYFPGPDFDFGGRVHTNGNLFLAAFSTTPGLAFHGKITAVRDVVRAELANGISTTTPPFGAARVAPVWIPRVAGGCDGALPPATDTECRDLNENEGSLTGGPGSSVNSVWYGLSVNTYSSNILDGDTGARPLNLPFVATGLRPIEIIRRPPAGEPLTALVAGSRLYNLAQIRVLLADDANELPGGSGDSQNVFLYNEAGRTYPGGVPVPGADPTYFATGRRATDGGWINPPGKADTDEWPLLEGYLRVETRRADGSYVAVTQEWLQLGFARGHQDAPDFEFGRTNTVHPNAILILQQLADRDADGDVDELGGGNIITDITNRRNWYPINLYDTREGEVRDVDVNDRSCAIGGIMSVAEFDVRNLRRWLFGEIGTTGTAVEDSSQNGFILYFSDRRGMRSDPLGGGLKRGEYGFEDTINPADPAGNPNSVLDAPEDVNANGRLDAYGRENLGDGFLVGAQGGDTPLDSPLTRLDNSPAGEGDCLTNGRKNRVTGARHGIKLINGTLGNLPTNRTTGLGGFTVASENGVYVVGNYNANDSGFGGQHAAAAVIADAVMLLSKDWRDINSFIHPRYIDSGTARRAAPETWYRLAVAAGKNINWRYPAWTNDQDYGLDGGTHNFLRYLERWRDRTIHYQGSLVSLYYSEYNTGIFKCCWTVYTPPTRDYSFDTDFLSLATMPPGTPMLRDVVNLGFRQTFRPPQ